MSLSTQILVKIGRRAMHPADYADRLIIPYRRHAFYT
jgi:hypothetical protein